MARVSMDSQGREVLRRFHLARRRVEERRRGCSRKCSRPDRPIWDKADEIKEVEHKCDFLTHEIIQRLNRTFVTPIDREDIHALARSLDDVMDAIDASASLVRLYRLDERPLRRPRAGQDHHRLHARAASRAGGAREGQGCGRAFHRDQPARERGRPAAFQQAVSRLFDDEQDPIVVMKWKETLDFLEDATDRCEDVANVLEGVMVKNG